MRAVMIILIVALVGIFLMTLVRDQEVRDTPNSTILMILQVYIEGAFYAVTAIGIGIAAYIGTRIKRSPHEQADYDRAVLEARVSSDIMRQLDQKKS